MSKLGWFCMVCKTFFSEPQRELHSKEDKTSVRQVCPNCGSVFIMELTEITIKRLE